MGIFSKSNTASAAPLLDLHNHTIVSGHAYSTMQEMVREAADKGLEYFGLVEHGPSIPGTCDPLYFWNYPVVPREMYGVKLLLGAELNILDTRGNLDLSEPYYKRMDFRIAGIHSLCWEGADKEANTRGVITAMQNPYVNIISHPGDGTAELDFKALAMASRDTKCLLEINNTSLKPFRHKTSAPANNLEILKHCKKLDIPVILGADAHISFDVLSYCYVQELLDKARFPQELIVNYNPKLFFQYTGLKCK